MKMMIIRHGARRHVVRGGDALCQKKMKKEKHGAWSFLKRLYHITYIKIVCDVNPFHCLFECASSRVLIGRSLLKYQEVRALPTVQPFVINATRSVSCHTSTNRKVTNTQVD